MGQIETVPPAIPPVEPPMKPQRFLMMRQLMREPKAVIGMAILALFVLVMIFAPLLTHRDPTAPLGIPWQPPNGQYLFGTTDQGQDVWAQWVWGTRTSMMVGIGVGVVSTFISVVIGVYSGYRGGKTDAGLNWFMYVMLVLPSFPLVLVIASFMPNAGTWAIMLVLGLTSWASPARVKRSQAMTFSNRDFVQAAKLSGVSDIRIMFTEILPNMYSLIFNTFIGQMQWGIFGEAFLRFVGIGTTVSPSWGNMLNWAQNGQALMNGGWWWFVPPGLSMTLVTLALTLINYGVDTVSNPKLAKPAKLPKRIREMLSRVHAERESAV